MDRQDSQLGADSPPAQRVLPRQGQAISQIGKSTKLFTDPFTAAINRISVGVARGLFLLYSVINGITLTSIFLAYGLVNVIYVFALTAVYFGALAGFGFVTKADLSKLRYVLGFGLIFLIIMGVLLWFVFPFAMVENIVCLFGIAIFLGITAYDTQKIRVFYEQYSEDADMLNRASIYSAFQLYLDFINLFLYLIRFLGNKKN